MNLTKKVPSVWGRGSGRTTAQIRSAPLGAWYVVHDGLSASYVQALAKHLHRDDLKVVSVSHDLRGTNEPVVVDHWCGEHGGDIYYQQHLQRVLQAQRNVTERAYLAQLAELAAAGIATSDEDMA